MIQTIQICIMASPVPPAAFKIYGTVNCGIDVIFVILSAEGHITEKKEFKNTKSRSLTENHLSGLQISIIAHILPPLQYSNPSSIICSVTASASWFSPSHHPSLVCFFSYPSASAPSAHPSNSFPFSPIFIWSPRNPQEKPLKESGTAYGLVIGGT